MPVLTQSGPALSPSSFQQVDPARKDQRIPSIDAVRGLVMMLMVVDHTRDYFHAYSQLFLPTDLTHTTAPIFLTRWITHFCAPGFVFLAGVSIRLMRRKRSASEISRFLLARGLLLVLLECTVIRMGWDFTLRHYFYAQIIWTLGWCMVGMALFLVVGRPVKILLLVTAFFAEFLLLQTNATVPLWRILCSVGEVRFGMGYFWVGYPLLRWFGVMLAGYVFGVVYDKSEKTRRTLTVFAGLLLIGSFIVLRGLNVQDVQQWVHTGTFSTTVLSFLNCTKIPASLPFFLMTLGPILLCLAYFDRKRGVTPFLSTLGAAPLVFYVAHLYVIHLLAVIVTYFRGQPIRWALPFTAWFPPPANAEFGFGLWVVYLVSALVILLLYPVCRNFGRLKQKKRAWFLRYL